MTLVAAVLRGLRRQLQKDGRKSLNSMEPGYTGHEDDNYMDEESVEQFYDDITGGLLPTQAVLAARKEELEFLRTFPVYEKVPEAQA